MTMTTGDRIDEIRIELLYNRKRVLGNCLGILKVSSMPAWDITTSRNRLLAIGITHIENSPIGKTTTIGTLFERI